MTVVLVLLAIGAFSGVPLSRLALLAGTAMQPVATGLGVVVLFWRRRVHRQSTATLFCDAVAAELRAGEGLRTAVASGLRSVGGPTSQPGQEWPELIEEAVSVAPEIGAALRLTLARSSIVGSNSALVFDELAQFALAKDEVDSELRAAAVPGVLTGAVLVGAPVFFFAFQAHTGSFALSLQSEAQRSAVLLGAGLFLLGLVLAVVILWRAWR